MSNPIVQQLFSMLVQVVALVLLALVARAVPCIVEAIRVRVKHKVLADVLAYLTTLAGQLVAAQADRVRGLKDPTKPGTWTQVTAHEVRDGVLRDLEHLGAAQLQQLQQLVPGVKPGVLLSRLVESQVEALRRGAPVVNMTAVLGALEPAASAGKVEGTP